MPDPMVELPRHTVTPRTLILVFRQGKLLLMKFSGKGEHETAEKSARKDYYDPIGGHIEPGEDILDSARREAREEAGIELISPHVKGIIHVSGFAGKEIMLFVVVGKTNDPGMGSSLEGELVWVDPRAIDHLNIFEDLREIIDKVLSLHRTETFTGVSKFEGFKLKSIKLQ